MPSASSYPVPGTSFTSLSTFLQSVQSVRPSLPQPVSSSSSAPSPQDLVELLVKEDQHGQRMVVRCKLGVRKPGRRKSGERRRTDDELCDFSITAELDPNRPRSAPRFLVTDYTPHSPFAHSFPWGMSSPHSSNHPLTVACEPEEHEPMPGSGRDEQDQEQNDDEDHGPDDSPSSPSLKRASLLPAKQRRHQIRDPITGAFVRASSSSSSVGGIVIQASQPRNADSSLASEARSQPYVIPVLPSASSRCLYRQKRKRTREQRDHEGDEQWRAWREEVLELPAAEWEGGDGERRGMEVMEGKGALRSWGWWKEAEVDDEPMEPVAEAGAARASVADPAHATTSAEDDELLLMPPPASPSELRSRSPRNDRRRTRPPTEDWDESTEVVDMMDDEWKPSKGGRTRGAGRRGPTGKGRGSTKGTTRGSDYQPDPPTLRPRSNRSTAAIEPPVRLDSTEDPNHAESTFSTTTAAFFARPKLSCYSEQAVAPSTHSSRSGSQRLEGPPSPFPHIKGCELFPDVFDASASSGYLPPTPASSSSTQPFQLLPIRTHRFSPSPSLSPSDAFSPTTTTTTTFSPETTFTDSPATITSSPLLPTFVPSQSKDRGQSQDEEDVLQALLELGTSTATSTPAIGLGLVFETELEQHDVQPPVEGAVREEATLEEVKRPDEEAARPLLHLEEREKGLEADSLPTAERIEEEKMDGETKEAAQDEELEQGEIVQDSSPRPLSTTLVSSSITDTVSSSSARDDAFRSITVKDPRASRWMSAQDTDAPPSLPSPVESTPQPVPPARETPYQLLAFDQPSGGDPSLPPSVSPESTPSALSFKPRRSSHPSRISGANPTSLSPSSTSALSSKKVRRLTSPSLTFSIAEASRATAQEAARKTAREKEWDLQRTGEEVEKLRKRLWGGWKEGEGGKLDSLYCPTSLPRKLARLSAASPSYTPPAILDVPRSPSSGSSGGANSTAAAPSSPYLTLLSPVVGRPPRPLLPSLNLDSMPASSLLRPRPPLPASTATDRRISFALEYLYGRTVTDAESAHLEKREKAFWGFVRTMAGVAEVNERYSRLEREERRVGVGERRWEERG
ncbi:hypothetical protein JCM5296_000309 [Sporobolomyces johnsonii]